MGLLSGFFKLVNPLVEEVLGQLTNQSQQWAEVIHKPIQDMIADVEDRGIWTGAGADLFVQECRTVLLPKGEDIVDRFEKKVEGISEARDIINEADKAAAQVAEGFVELAETILW